MHILDLCLTLQFTYTTYINANLARNSSYTIETIRLLLSQEGMMMLTGAISIERSHQSVKLQRTNIM